MHSYSVGSESAPHFNKVPVVVGSSSHGGERKRQLGLAITVSMSGKPLSGWDPWVGLSQ